ncbi:phage tail protein [Virgibacillus salexigens]|uniref:phage tail protein n=1 Tax=Virgibacillus salexigens TaxID=61016 RepID=UPI00190CCF1D|nr:hypothetical protein [Virgibacillus salexigens]
MGDASKKAGALGAAGAAAIGGLVTGMEEYNRIMARLNTNATNQGLDPSVMEDYAKKVASVSGEMDSAIETVSNLMATDLSESQMAQAIDEINGAAIRFSDTLKTEGIADGLQETLATGEAIGPFAELLERSGVNLEEFNSGLAAAQKNGEATNFVLEELSKTGLSNVYSDYQKLNPEVVAQQEAQQDLTSSLAEFAKNLMPLVTMVTAFLAVILDWINGNFELVKSFDTIAEGLQVLITNLVNNGMQIVNSIIQGITQNLPMIIQTGVQILQNLIQGLITALPMLMEAWQNILLMQAENISLFLPQIIQLGIQLIQSLIQGILIALPVILEVILNLLNTIVRVILENLPMIIQSGIQIVNAVVSGIIQHLPQLITTVITVLNTLISTIVQNLPLIIQAGIQLLNAIIEGVLGMLPELINMTLKLVNTIFDVILQNLPTIIDAGIQLLSAVVDGLANALPQLIQMALTLIIELAGALLSHLPRIIAAGVDILFALIDGLIETIPDLVAAIPQIIDAIFNAFGDVDWLDIGVNIIQGLIDGVLDMADSLVDSVKGVVDDAIQGAKNLLGIKSPSRVFRQIGEYTGEGLELGIKSMGNRVARAGENLGKMAVPDMQGTDMQGINSGAFTVSGNSAGNKGINYEELGKAMAKYLNFTFNIDGETLATAVNTTNAVNSNTNKYF